MDDKELNRFEKLSPRICKNGKSRSDIARSSIAKGKRGERFIADLITDISGFPFRRIPNSGARVGQINRDKIYEYSENQLEGALADLFPPNGLKYRFIVESKNYKQLSFNKLAQEREPAQIAEWIDEILYDTESYLMFKSQSKYPLREPLAFLGFKITNMGTWIAYSPCYFEKLQVTHFNPTYKIIHQNLPFLLLSIGYTPLWYIEPMKEFLISNKSDLFLSDK